MGYEKPKAHRRTRVITPEEYEKLLAKADPNFRRVITALRMTGCRPGEVRTLIWEWVDLESKLWIIPDHKTVTRQTNPQPRIIPLPDAIVEMCKLLAQQPHKPAGPRLPEQVRQALHQGLFRPQDGPAAEAGGHRGQGR